jgi:hypothetical protein
MGNIGEGIVQMFCIMAAIIILTAPLGIWKAIELIHAFFSHVYWK